MAYMFLGITNICTGATGFISLNANTSSSSYTLFEGISPLIILQKYNLPFYFSPYYSNIAFIRLTPADDASSFLF